jgi:hypothetical protein
LRLERLLRSAMNVIAEHHTVTEDIQAFTRVYANREGGAAFNSLVNEWSDRPSAEATEPASAA